jgi:hypothetical protein
MELTFPTDALSQINMARSELSSSWLKLFELSVRQDGLKLSDFGETPESIALLRKQCDVVEAHEALDEARAKRKSSWLSLFEQIVRNHGLKFEDFGETPESIEELRRQCSPE